MYMMHTKALPTDTKSLTLWLSNYVGISDGQMIMQSTVTLGCEVHGHLDG